MPDTQNSPPVIADRVPTPAEFARDILIAVINRSNTYDPKVLNEHNSTHQVDLIAYA